MQIANAGESPANVVPALAAGVGFKVRCAVIYVKAF